MRRGSYEAFFFKLTDSSIRCRFNSSICTKFSDSCHIQEEINRGFIKVVIFIDSFELHCFACRIIKQQNNAAGVSTPSCQISSRAEHEGVTSTGTRNSLLFLAVQREFRVKFIAKFIYNDSNIIDIHI